MCDHFNVARWNVTTVSYIKRDYFIYFVEYWGICCYVSTLGDVQSCLSLLVGSDHRAPLTVCDKAVETDCSKGKKFYHQPSPLS